MTAAAILNLLFLVVFFTQSTSGSSRQHHCKITLAYVNRRLSFYPRQGGYVFAGFCLSVCVCVLAR